MLYVAVQLVSINTLGEVRSSFVTVKVVPFSFAIVIVNVAFDSITVVFKTVAST